MAANQPLWPRDWLMTDERMGDRLLEAIGRVPSGTGGIVFRHYSLGPRERLELGKSVAEAARARKLVLAVAADPRLAEQLDARLVHNPSAPSELPISRSVHHEPEARSAAAEGAALVFVSPIYPTRSHPNAPALGPERAARLGKLAGCPAIALGGMTFGRFWELGDEFHGWAGIDAWLND